MIKVGFIINFKSSQWLGGYNYYKNLFKCLDNFPNKKIIPVIITDKKNELLQDELLSKGSDLTSKNGTLIYVTCSVLESEGEDRIEAFLGRTPGFEVVDVDSLWPSVLDGDRPDRGPFVNLSPATCGTDGFFVAVLLNTA